MISARIKIENLTVRTHLRMASPSADLLAKVAPLLAALKDGRNIQSLSTQEHDVSAKKTRKLLCDFMDSVLGDASKAFQPIENTSHLHMMLRILLHCIDSSPESFVGVESRLPIRSEIPGSVSYSNVYSSNRISEVSKAFTVWVISGLWIILAERKYAEFKDSASTAILSILQDKEELHFAKRSLCIQNEERCYYLQESVSEIVSQVTTDIPHFAHSSLLTLWKCVCQQLYTGLTNVKKASLDIVTSLLLEVGLPVVPTLDVLVKCLAALVELLGSGSCCDLPREKITPLEKSLAKCLSMLFRDYHSKGSGTNQGKQKKAFFVLPPWHVSYILTSFAGTLSASGLEKLQTSELQIAIVRVILYIYVHVPVGYEDIKVISYQTRHSLNLSLVSFIGKVTQQQYIVQCFYEAVKESNVDKLSQPGSNEEVVKKKPALSGRESSASYSQSELTGKEPSFDLLENLAQKMNNLLKCLNQEFIGEQRCFDKLCNNVEGVRVVLEIVIRSCFECEPGSCRQMNHICRKGKAWFTSTRLSHLFVTMKSILQFLVKTSENYSQNDERQRISDVFSKLVQITGALYYGSGWISLPTELCQFVVFLVSIPWLWKMNPPWMDVPSAFGWTVKTMADISVRMKDILDIKIQNECLQLLAVFPREVSPTWRSHVFTLVMSGAEAPKKYGLRWLSTLLSSLGSFSYSFIQDHLPTLLSTSSDTEVQVELGTCIGQLACVLTEKTEIRRSLKIPFQEPVGCQVRLCCPSCDVTDQPVKTSFNNQGAVKTGRIRTELLSPFVVQLLVPNTPASAKLSVIASIKRMSTHMADTAESTAYSSIACTACFDLIEDGDYEVRMAFSQVIHHLLKPVGQPILQGLQKTVMAKLKKAFLEASVRSNTKLQETVVQTIGQLGRTADGDLLLVVVISLLDNLTAQSRFIRAIAFAQIQEVAKYQGKSTQDLFVEFKQQICSFLVDAMHEAQVLTQPGKEPQVIITEVAMVFKFRETQVFLKNILRYIIPYLVKKATSAASSVLSFIAKILKVNRVEMLLENFKYIFSLLVRMCSAPELQKALSYIQKETNVELGSLLRSEAMSVYNQLLLYLSVSYNKVFSGLAMLASMDDSYAGCKDLKTRDDMANFLQSRLLGILAFYNTVLLGTNSDMEEKRLALESLIKLMEIMGAKHITTVRMKVMGILRQALRLKDHGFIELSCEAWDCFVRNIHLNCLGPMLSHIMVTLLPYLTQLPVKVAHIFYYLIVENRSKLHDYFLEIYFLPDIPELIRVNAVLHVDSGNLRNRQT